MALPPHPCFAKPKLQSLINPEAQITSTLKDFMVDALPKDYPYSLDKMPKHESRYMYRIPFFEFRGQGPPPCDIGSDGDVYVDMTPERPALYAKAKTEWRQWAGPPIEWNIGALFSHPHFEGRGHQGADRQLWCNGRKIIWYSTGSAQNHWRHLSRSGVLNPAIETKDLGRVVAGNLIAEMLKEERHPEFRKKRERPTQDVKGGSENKKRKVDSKNVDAAFQSNQSLPSTSKTVARNKSSQNATSTSVSIRPPRISGTTSRVRTLQLMKAEQQEANLSSVSRSAGANGVQESRNMTEKKKSLQSELDCLKKEVRQLIVENDSLKKRNRELLSERGKDVEKNATMTGEKQETEYEAFPPDFLKFMTDAYAKNLGFSMSFSAPVVLC
jgi:hypothetical protein